MKLGVKAWWKDADVMARLGTKLMEVHLEPEDISMHYQEMKDIYLALSKEQGFELVVHTQEYWADGGDYHLVDLSSRDAKLRKTAVKILKKTLAFASEIHADFVIVHPGGITPENIEKEYLLSNLTQSLSEINDEHLIVENMPWFYIMRNGQVWRSNICIEAEDFFRFSELVGGVTLDICHAYLSTKEGGNQYIQNMKSSLKKMIEHVHVSDAKPPHQEGMQIGEGGVDFNLIRNLSVGIVPEIIGGHENYGEGFKIALSRLRTYE